MIVFTLKQYYASISAKLESKVFETALTG